MKQKKNITEFGMKLEENKRICKKNYQNNFCLVRDLSLYFFRM